MIKAVRGVTEPLFKLLFDNGADSIRSFVCYSYV